MTATISGISVGVTVGGGGIALGDILAGCSCQFIKDTEACIANATAQGASDKNASQQCIMQDICGNWDAIPTTCFQCWADKTSNKQEKEAIVKASNIVMDFYSQNFLPQVLYQDQLWRPPGDFRCGSGR